ncbi:MAG: MMPL family transporter [Thermoleophilia bacterium]|nr:MMPL family transporter [Thermoleophilia bacterium]
MIRFRWLVLGGWLMVVALLLATGLPSFGREGLSLEELASPDSPEVQTELDALRLFRIPLNAREQVVRRDEDGLAADVKRDDIAAAVGQTRAVQDGRSDDDAILLSLPFTNAGGAFPASRESSTTTIVNLFGNPNRSLSSQVRAGERIASDARDRGPGDVNLTGGIPAQLETGRVVRDSLGTLQLASIVALVLITLLWFRALAPSLVVISTIAVTMLLMLEALSVLTGTFGVGVPAEVLPVVLVVAIGIASDYALFHVAAWDRLVKAGASPHEATLGAIGMNAPVVLTAGATTSLGAASLLLADTAFIRSFAPALIASILVAIIVGLLLVPALLAVLGRHLLWPRRPRPSTGSRATFATRAAAWLTRPRAATLVVVATAVVLGALGANAASSPLGFNVITALPDDDPIVVGARDAGAGFAPGILSPTLLVIDGTDLGERREQLGEFTRRLEQLDGVGGVIGTDSLLQSIERAGVSDDLNEIGVELAGTDASRGEAARSLARKAATTAAVRDVGDRLLVTDDGRHARLVIVLEHEAYTGNAVRALRELRPSLQRALEGAGLGDAKLRVAGDTALVERITRQMNADLLRIALFLVVVEVIVLLISLRSLLLAVVLVASGVATTLAAFGILSIYDRTLGPGDGIAFFVPISAFVLLLSIGLDYGVLAGSTLRRAQARGDRGLEMARATIDEAYPSVMLAGVVIASTFALLGIVDLESFRQIAIVMCCGVIVDAFVVRPITVPLVLGFWDRRRRVEAANG